MIGFFRNAARVTSPSNSAIGLSILF